MYIIIVGAGDIGTPLIKIATRSGNEVVAIERDAQKAEEVASEYDCMVLNADATLKETLDEAGADRADAIVSTTDQDATNVMVCLLAKEFEIPVITSVVHDAEHMNLFHQIEVSTIENPQQLIAEHFYRVIAEPAIIDHMKVGNKSEIFEIEVGENAPIDGLSLSDAGKENLLPEETVVVAIVRDDELYVPQATTLILSGDVVTVFARNGPTNDIMYPFTGE